MDDMVSRVVEVLDEGSFYLHPGRVMKSRLAKKRPPPRKIRKTFPQTTTGEKEASDKGKERERKNRKEVSPNTPQRWDGNKWVKRKQDSQYYKDKIRTEEVRKEEIEKKIQPLLEVSGRTVGIGLSLATIKKWSSNTHSGIQKMKSISSQMKTAKDETEWRKLDGEWKSIDADVDGGNTKMLWYLALLTTSGVVGLEKTLTRKLKNTKRR